MTGAKTDCRIGEIATFFRVFPNGTIWSNDTVTGDGYDVVLLGTNGPAAIDLDALDGRFAAFENRHAVDSLREVGFLTWTALLSTYAGRAADLQGWLAGAQLNRDRDLRLQYLAGLGLNLRRAESIYGTMLKHQQFPADLFTGSEQRRLLLRRALGR